MHIEVEQVPHLRMETKYLKEEGSSVWPTSGYYRLKGSVRQLAAIQNFAGLLALLNALTGLVSSFSTASSVALGFAVGGCGFSMTTSLIVISRFEKNRGIFPQSSRVVLSFFIALISVVVSFICTGVSFYYIIPGNGTSAIIGAFVLASAACTIAEGMLP